jgi:hypothetical protein
MSGGQNRAAKNPIIFLLTDPVIDASARRLRWLVRYKVQRPHGWGGGGRMHMLEWVLAGAARVGMGGAASAQQASSSFFSGIPATQVKNVPLDMSAAVVQHPGQSALTSNRFDFSALFSKLPLPSFPALHGYSPFPAPSSFPSTKYPNARLVGTPPFPIRYMFGGDKSPIQPVAPFTPSAKTPVGPGSG